MQRAVENPLVTYSRDVALVVGFYGVVVVLTVLWFLLGELWKNRRRK